MIISRQASMMSNISNVLYNIIKLLIEVVRVSCMIGMGFIYPQTPQLHLCVVSNDLVLFNIYSYFNYDINREALIMDPTHVTNIFDYFEYCRYLGADMMGINTRGRTPLLIAVQLNNVKFVKQIILLGGDINKSGYQECPPVCWAIKKRHNKIAKILISAGAKLNNTNHLLSIMLAVSMNTDMIEPLIDAGADVNLASGALDETPLISAIRNNQEDALQLLIDHNANIEQPCGIMNFTPLLKAINMRENRFVQLLLENGADPNKMVENESPIVLAIKEHQIDSLRLLIEHGADVNNRGVQGETCIQTLQKMQLRDPQCVICNEILTILINAGLNKTYIDCKMLLHCSLDTPLFADRLINYHGDDYNAFLTIKDKHPIVQLNTDCIDIIGNFLRTTVPKDIVESTAIIRTLHN